MWWLDGEGSTTAMILFYLLDAGVHPYLEVQTSRGWGRHSEVKVAQLNLQALTIIWCQL